MSIEGRINVDVLFHDTNGTNAINVVSLQRSKEYATGKVAIISGTASNSPAVVYLPQNGIGYRDATGEIVTFSSVAALAVFGQDIAVEAIGIGAGFEFPGVFLSVYSSGDFASITQLPYVAEEIHVRAQFSNTSPFTLVLYGS
jgi:hypothetical protein